MRITEINTVIKSVEYAGETFINLQELHNLLKSGFRIEMEECLITPYYIQDKMRTELYQYEFCCTNEVNFEEYILKLTGKEKIVHIPEEIRYLRKKCFSTCHEDKELAEFLQFLFDDKNLQEEIRKMFGNYNAVNLYAVVYS